MNLLEGKMLIMNKVETDFTGVSVFEPTIFEDSRGIFFEWFRFDSAAEGNFQTQQGNCSISKKGTLRGIHFALLPEGQQKQVMCVSGAVIDVLVDLRKDSLTYGQHRQFELNDRNRKILSIPNGIGHSFVALEENTCVIYLCDKKYNQSTEVGINPFDADLNISWPLSDQLIVSEKDLNAPSFQDMMKKFTF